MTLWRLPMKKILILGAGTAGALIANMLSRKLARDEWSVTVVDRATEHVYQPGMLFLPFRLYGYKRREHITRPIRDPLPQSARFIQAEVESIDSAARRVQTSGGTLEYDWLVLALGCRLGTGEIDGFSAAMDSGGAHTFYTVDGALRMQQALADLDRGRLVLNIADMPIKCPVAPIEFVFLADYYYQRLGRRGRVSITLVTPLSGAFTKPVASEIMTEVARRKGIDIVTDFTVERLDAQTKTLHSFEGKSVSYDLLCMIPPNLGPSVLTDAGLADESGYALTEPRTLKSRKDEHIYVIGDNSNVATSKAGSVAHFEAETLVENLLREMDGRRPLASFDGHANCFVETGHHKAMLLDFNYDVEPLPGKFPLPWIGPLSLLQESYFNHWGKIL
ncbi:MAG TPA: FAD-dependent oxidoreductase, partial [Sulfuricaulis sp.]